MNRSKNTFFAIKNREKSKTIHLWRPLWPTETTNSSTLFHVSTSICSSVVCLRLETPRSTWAARLVYLQNNRHRTWLEKSFPSGKYLLFAERMLILRGPSVDGKFQNKSSHSYSLLDSLVISIHVKCAPTMVTIRNDFCRCDRSQKAQTLKRLEWGEFLHAVSAFKMQRVSWKCLQFVANCRVFKSLSWPSHANVVVVIAVVWTWSLFNFLISCCVPKPIID